MKILRIKAYQLFANYRKPMSYNYWDSYPLPPLSTIRGWFHYVVWNVNKDENRHYIPISMSIQGKFSSVIQDLQTLIKFDRVRLPELKDEFLTNCIESLKDDSISVDMLKKYLHKIGLLNKDKNKFLIAKIILSNELNDILKSKKIDIEEININMDLLKCIYDQLKCILTKYFQENSYLENFDKFFNKSPTYVTNIFDINLHIYIKAEEHFLHRFIENVFKLEYPSIGRYEDLVRIDELKIIEPELIDLYEEPHDINYGIYINKKTADYFGLRGINYRMNFKYDGDLLNKTGLRYFEREDIVYVDNAVLEKGEILFDEEENRIIDLVGD